MTVGGWQRWWRKYKVRKSGGRSLKRRGVSYLYGSVGELDLKSNR